MRHAAPVTHWAHRLTLALLLTAAACNNGSSSPALTATPTPTVITETFNGTVHIGSSDFNPFTVTQAGTVNITLTVAGPPPTIFMGLGVGTPSGSTCALISGGTTITPAGTAAQLSGTIAAGAYCVQVYDVGNQVGDVTYTVTVAHT
jgi:hypothetical protein